MHQSQQDNAVQKRHTYLERLHVSPEALPQIKELYHEHIAALQEPTLQERVSELEDRIERLKEEEAALARLYARGKLTDKNSDSLYHEWQSKVFETQREIGRLESDTTEMVNGLDHALFLLTLAPLIFERLETKSKRRLLQILFKRSSTLRVRSPELNSIPHLSIWLPCLTATTDVRNQPEARLVRSHHAPSRKTSAFSPPPQEMHFNSWFWTVTVEYG